MVSRPEAELKLAILHVEAETIEQADAIAFFSKSNIPPEVINRVGGLWAATRQVGEQAISIGKILVTKIIEFVKANPNMVLGAALGAAVGALTGLVPALIQTLQPLSSSLCVALGTVAGYRNDRGYQSNCGTIGVTQDALEIAKKFFRLIADIFNAVFSKEALQTDG